MLSIAARAGELRLRAGQINPPFSTRIILDTAFPTALVTGCDLPDGVDEVVSITDGDPVILYRRGLPVPEQRFAIAHALGHLVFDRIVGACRPGYVGDPTRELRADEFAAELLVPFFAFQCLLEWAPADEGADRDLYLDQVDRLASLFNVTAAVMDERVRAFAARFSPRFFRLTCMIDRQARRALPIRVTIKIDR